MEQQVVPSGAQGWYTINCANLDGTINMAALAHVGISFFIDYQIYLMEFPSMFHVGYFYFQLNIYGY